MFKSYLKMYQNYYQFGQSILDKVAVMAGFTKSLSYEFDGEHYLTEMVTNKSGGILLSAHIGNWEIAGHLLKRLNTTINIVMYDGEYQKLKDYLSDVIGQRKVNIIPVRDDISHIFHIGKALRNKEIICMHADRFIQGNKVITGNFMGEAADFPLGPFTIATHLKVPVSFVFAMKEKATHYHLSATPPKVYDGKEPEVLKDYIAILEKKIKQYPEQWYNYYRFWGKAA